MIPSKVARNILIKEAPLYGLRRYSLHAQQHIPVIMNKKGVNLQNLLCQYSLPKKSVFAESQSVSSQSASLPVQD